MTDSSLPKIFCIYTVLLAFLGLSLQADVRIPGFFNDHMVLQRDMPVPIWGWADPGETVKVSFSGKSYSATADKEGKWTLKLSPLKATMEGQNLVIGAHTIKDVLVGEVWLCSGQSNMQWAMNKAMNPKEEMAAANYPLIRHVAIKNTSAYLPKSDVEGAWTICSPQSVGKFSGVAYFFGRKLHKELNIPIGLINASWGGTGIDPWISPYGYGLVAPEVEDCRSVVYSGLPITAEGKKAWEKYLRQMKEWLPGAQKKVEAGELPINRPARPNKLNESHHGHTKIFNAMINPLIPYAMRGAIWYQGESNGGEGMSYFHKLRALIGGWRHFWGQGDFPFYLVQLANVNKYNPKPEGGDGYAKIREAQRKCLELKNTGMAVITDIGETKNIHPKNKQDVGLRLAYWALAKDYGYKDLVYSGPLYDNVEVKGKTLVVHFQHTGSGLVIGKKEGLSPITEIKGPLKGFAMCGADKKWYWADAVITNDGKSVVLSSPEVPAPTAARYAYRWNPLNANLYNKEGLPASAFRTDKGGR
ncbi:MAG: 9-O-acetylesterase [Planctomycetes bacterium]|nr:9-O-acetylesterase [Planctomycetota bacterium]